MHYESQKSDRRYNAFKIYLITDHFFKEHPIFPQLFISYYVTCVGFNECITR